MEVEEEFSPPPPPPARLWHQEGAQQPWKAEQPPEPKLDAALAIDHRRPPLTGKRSRRDRLRHLRTCTTTPTPLSAATVSSNLSPRRSTVAPLRSCPTETMSPSRRISLDPTAHTTPYPFAYYKSLTSGPASSAFY